VLRNRQLTIPPNVGGNAKKDTIRMLRLLKKIFKREASITITTDSGKRFVDSPQSDDFYDRLNKFNRDNFPEKKINDIEFIWCLVGNVIEKHFWGENKEIRIGTKQFSPGTKLYCYPVQWGDGYQKVKVIGRPRKFKKFINVVINSDYITNWRKEKVYNPFIIKQLILNKGWDNSEESDERLNLLYESLIDYQKDKK